LARRIAQWDDPLTMNAAPGPSLAKATAGRVIRSQTLTLLRVLDGWWAHVLGGADIMSEGEVVAEAGGESYYGSTSVRFLPEPRPAMVERFDAAALARLVLADPHARSRLVRIVHREATSRAGRPLGVLRVELRTQALGVPDGRGGETQALQVDADVSAPVLAKAARRARPRR
jgi:hypothetical protein